MNTSEKVQAVIAPLIADLGLDLYDLEHNKSVVRITLDTAEGIASDQLTEATRLISRALDEADPIPAAYTLEVSSPGLERTLRKPEHFASAVGDRVSIKTNPGVEGERRVEGTLASADDEQVVVDLDDDTRTLALSDILKARTVFEWDAATPRKTHKPEKPTPSDATP